MEWAMSSSSIAAAILGLWLWAGFAPAVAGSPLLERVKANPALARQMCARFRQLNAQGISATSPQAIAMVAQEHGLSAIDAEVLTTYVMGMHCSDVR
jgi:hypothetical protein